ncbi:MAG: hypothetical protein ABIR29_03720, partial [Chthoniobacterales bacterium]
MSRSLQASHSIIIEPVTDKKSLRRFIHLPQRLYEEEPRWVPPIYADEWRFHDPKHNAALAHSEVVRVIARRGRQPVGRVMGIINRQHNEKQGEATARFFGLDCIDDVAVARALLRAVEQWAKGKGMRRVIGPFGFSDKDPQGLQIEGFEYLPVIAAPSNPAYLPVLVEDDGYAMAFDCVSYKLPLKREALPVYEKIYQRLMRRGELELVE